MSAILANFHATPDQVDKAGKQFIVTWYLVIIARNMTGTISEGFVEKHQLGMLKLDG